MIFPQFIKFVRELVVSRFSGKIRMKVKSCRSRSITWSVRVLAIPHRMTTVNYRERRLVHFSDVQFPRTTIVDRHQRAERRRLPYIMEMGQEIMGRLQFDDLVLFGLACTVRRIQALIQLISECECCATR